MTGPRWTRADVQRAQAALDSWASQATRSLPDPGWGSPDRSRAYRVAWEALGPWIQANATSVILGHLDRVSSGSLPGVQGTEVRAAGRLASRIRADGAPPGLVLPLQPDLVPQDTPPEAATAPRTVLDPVALARRQTDHQLAQDVLEGRVQVHMACGPVGDTDALWGDYPDLVPWRVIAGPAGGWVQGDLVTHWPAFPRVVDLRGLPGRHGMLDERAVVPLVRVLQALGSGVHLVTDGPADLLARVLPRYVGPQDPG